PVRVSATLSTVFFAEPLASSTRPSFFRCLSPLSEPAACFTRPFALSMFERKPAAPGPDVRGLHPRSHRSRRRAGAGQRGGRVVCLRLILGNALRAPRVG